MAMSKALATQVATFQDLAAAEGGKTASHQATTARRSLWRWCLLLVTHWGALLVVALGRTLLVSSLISLLRVLRTAILLWRRTVGVVALVRHDYVTGRSGLCDGSERVSQITMSELGEMGSMGSGDR